MSKEQKKHDDVPILQQYLKKKGTKFGFWHKRFCILFNNKLVIKKKEGDEDMERTIDITPECETELSSEEHMHRIAISQPGFRTIMLGSEDPEAILNWAQHIRNITFMTPDLSIDDFEIVSVLGRGYYGKVMLCRKLDTNEYFAIKTVHKNRLIKANKVHTIFTERNVLMGAQHPFIVNLRFAFQNQSKVYLGLEYASGGELFYQLQQRGTLPIDQVRLYVAELSLALNYLHNHGIVYRDLKPENILLDKDGHVKLTDFGLSKILDVSQMTTTFCGTSEYLAPEIVAKRPYGFEIDWWSVGVLTYELLFGQTPFYDQNKVKMFQAIRCDRPRFPKKADKNAVEFISMLLEKNPEERASFDRILGHPFFKKMNFEDVLMKKIKPQFVPAPSSHAAVNFDEAFTMENPQDSLATPASHASEAFQGFSFVGPVQEESSGPAVDPSFIDDSLAVTSI